MVTSLKEIERKLAKPIFSAGGKKRPLHIAESVQFWSIVQVPSCAGLHNDVDIKMGIIYKNCKYAQKHLKFKRFWSIVLKQCA